MRQPNDSIENTVITGLVEGSRSRGWPKICWFDNIMAWTGLLGSRLLHVTMDRGCWSSVTHACSLLSQSNNNV